MAEPFDPFDDQPLVRSLREPGTPAELADQDHYLAMFREARGDGKAVPLSRGSRRSGGRAARLGAGTTLSIAIAVAGGGVAAAYTANLPEPLQQFAHEVLGPVHVPPPTEQTPDRVAAAPEPEPSPSSQESPSASPTATPTAEASEPAGADPSLNGQASPSDTPSESSSGEPTSGPSSTPTPTATPTPTSTPTPTPTPTTTPTATPSSTPTPTTAPDLPRPASVSIVSTTHRVEYAASPLFSGVVVDDDEAAVPEVQVALMQLVDGAWRRVAFATTDEDGAVSLSAPPVYENTAMRLKTKGARSDRWRVTVHPELTLSPTVDGDTVTVVAAAVGGQEGDVVRLSGRRDGQRVTLATGILGADGTVTFQVQQKATKARYGALLDATDAHTADRAVVEVTKPQTPKGDDEETPSPSP